MTWFEVILDDFEITKIMLIWGRLNVYCFFGQKMLKLAFGGQVNKLQMQVAVALPCPFYDCIHGKETNK